MRTYLAIALLAACGGKTTDPTPPRQLGVREHLEEAEEHDRDAKLHESSAAESSRRGGDVGDCQRVLADTPTSGGERLLASTPCWTAESSAADRHREIARELREAARAHRTRARELSEAERAACGGMPPEELEHSIFAHREDIAAVEALVEEDRIRGARIRFEPVAGLSADYLRASIACHQARAAALGYEPTYFGYDPTALAGVDVSVLESDGGLVIVLRASDPATALAAYGRAEALLP